MHNYKKHFHYTASSFVCTCKVCTLCFSFYDEHIDGCGINFCTALGNNFVIVGPLTKIHDVSVLTGLWECLYKGFGFESCDLMHGCLVPLRFILPS